MSNEDFNMLAFFAVVFGMSSLYHMMFAAVSLLQKRSNWPAFTCGCVFMVLTACVVGLIF